MGTDIWLSRDQSGNSRASAERNALLEGVSDRVELVHADAHDLPFDPETFDVVTSSLVFHNIAGDDGRDRRLDWRMGFGLPVNVTGLVCARKPES